MKVLIKAMRPHRQKVLTEDGEEMRLQRWANKAASSALRRAGGDATGEQFTQAREALMREAVANPDEHGLKFMGERMPFDGQELEESLSEPDVEGEQGPESGPDEWMGDESPEHFENLREQKGVKQFEQLRGGNLFDEQGKLRQTLPQGEEKEEEFDPDAEAEHLRRIMTSRDVAMRDAWSVLKNVPSCQVCQGELNSAPDGEGMVCQNANCPAVMMRQDAKQPPKLRFPAQMFPTGGFKNLEEMTQNARNNRDYSRDMYSKSVLKNDFFNPQKVPCAKCGRPTEPMMYYGSNEMGPQHNTLCEECEDNTMMEDQ